MSKAIIVYESKWGNTRLVAESIAEGMKEASGIPATLGEVKAVKLTDIGDFDTVLVGSPNHIGRATASIRKFIDKLGKISVEGKQAAAFDTYVGGDFEKAVKKMEKQIREKVPGLKLIAPGLSIEVKAMKGPIADGELAKCRDFGVRIAEQVAQPRPR